MAIYLQGPSALEHYRRAGTMLDFQPEDESFDLSDAASSLAAVQDVHIYRASVREPSAGHPLHVLVGKRGQRARQGSVIARVWGSPITKGAFYCVSKDLYVSSPEFLFLQMARNYELPELVALGMELCGNYRRDVPVPKLGEDGYDLVTAYQVPSITTPEKLQAFIEQTAGSPGARRAQRALRFILPASASPMETATYLLLCLPYRLGGYGLPQPVLNPSIRFNKGGRRFTVRLSARPDLFWEDAKLDAEYLGDDYHTSENRAADSMRRKALERMHIEVIDLTKEELENTEVFHAVALRIAKSLGKRIRYDSPEQFAQRRAHLRSLVLPTRASGESAYLPVIDVDNGLDASDDWFSVDQEGVSMWTGDDWWVDVMDSDDGGHIFGRTRSSD